MRKKILISGLLCLLIFFHVSIPVYALDTDDGDFRTVEPLTYDAYSFADLAAARLAGYGFLPEYYKTPQKETTAPITRADGVWLLYTVYGYETGKPCPFSDVPKEYQEAVTWAYEEGLVSGIGNGSFGMGKMTRNSFKMILQRLLENEGIPSVIIIGATTGKGKTVDHAWNKVKVDGKWYNIDLCWADTENTTKYDLKSDQSFAANYHWAEVYQGGEMAAAESYPKSLR